MKGTRTTFSSKEIMKQMLEHKKKHDKLHIGEVVEELDREQSSTAPQIREYGNIVIVHHTK